MSRMSRTPPAATARRAMPAPLAGSRPSRSGRATAPPTSRPTPTASPATTTPPTTQRARWQEGTDGKAVDLGRGRRAAEHHAAARPPAGVRAPHRLPQARPLRALPPRRRGRVRRRPPHRGGPRADRREEVAVGYVEDLRGKKQGRGRPRWRARWRDPAGRERSKSFARKVDAERFLVGIEDAKLRGAYVDPAAGKVELGEWAERWFATTATLRPSTRRDYRNLLDNQVLPTFADVPLNAIDTLAVREWQAGLIASGLGGKRAGKALQVLSQVLASAVDGGKLARNAASAVKPP